MLSIEDVINYIPENTLDVTEQLYALNISKAEAKVFKKIYKLEQVPRSNGESFIPFIKKSLLTLLERSKCNYNDIKYIIHTHTGRVVSPFGESLLNNIKNQIGLYNTQIFSVSLNNCASPITAISIANQLLSIETNVASRVIIIATDISFTPVLQVIPNVSVMGDASTAVMLNKSNKKNRLIKEVSNIYGRYAAGSWMNKLDSIEFELQYVEMVKNTIYKALHESHLILDDIKIILPHNVNYVSWEKIRNELNLNKDKIYLENIGRFGHCFGSDIFINYESAISENLIKSTDYYMMVTVGLGATVSVAIFQY